MRLAYDLTAGGEAEYSSSGTGADSVMIRMRVTSQRNDGDCLVGDGNGNGYSPFDPAAHFRGIIWGREESR